MKKQITPTQQVDERTTPYKNNKQRIITVIVEKLTLLTIENVRKVLVYACTLLDIQRDKG